MSNYNELRLTYQGGSQETITLTGDTIEYGEYQRRDIVAVEVPEIVQTIGDYAFCDNNSLANIVLNEGLQRIEGQAFQHGVYTAVTIPSTVTEIGVNAFNTRDEQFQDQHTFTITCLAENPPYLGDYEGIIFGNPDLLTIYVPSESVELYKSVEGWSNYADKIQAIPEPPAPTSGSGCYIGDVLVLSGYIGNSAVTYMYIGDTQVFPASGSPEPPVPVEDPMLRQPLTFEFIEQGTGTTHGIGLRLTGVTSTDERDQYRHPLMYVLTHNGEKTIGYLDLTEDVSSSAVTSLMSGLTLGDTVELYAKEKQGALSTSTDIYENFLQYTAGDRYAVYGNVNSLLVTKDEFDDFDNATFIASAYTFQGLFSGKTAIDFGTPSSEKHILLPEPTNGLQESCYRNMFRASSITEAPKLPAETLAEYCYALMFNNCTSLTTAPELPATSLNAYCYYYMFRDCTSLTLAPVLPATTLADGCYHDMFSYCFSLTTAPELPATTLTQSCYASMFQACTSLTAAPELPATTLVDGCYNKMFGGCSKLNLIVCKATDITASACTTDWVRSVASTGTFIKDPNMTSWTTDVNGIPRNWTVLDAEGIHLVPGLKRIFEDESGEQTITILPFEDWTASTSDDWITFDKATGTSEDRTFSFNITSANEPRTGTITFTTNSNSVTFTLYQNDSSNRLTFNILTDGLITWKKTETAAVSGWNVNLYYRKNDAASWSTISIRSGGTSINVSAGDTLEFAGYQAAQRPLASGTTMYCWLGDSTAQFEARGNIMSLLRSNDYSGETTLESAYTFYGLFSGCTGLISAERLKLPATSLTGSCYSCMFDGCRNLTSAPELPATTLTASCYRYMFRNCKSLTTAPELPATTLVMRCYESMFQYCSNLNYIKCLAQSSITTTNLRNWVSGVSSSGTFVKAAGIIWTTGTNGIPSGWDVEEIEA